MSAQKIAAIVTVNHYTYEFVLMKGADEKLWKSFHLHINHEFAISASRFGRQTRTFPKLNHRLIVFNRQGSKFYLLQRFSASMLSNHC